MVDNDHMHKLFTCHRHCDDVINMKIDFQSDGRISCRLVKTGVIAHKDKLMMIGSLS